MSIFGQQVATYFPLDGGRYEVKTGLHRFGTDFGNGEADAKVFQLDASFDRYRNGKLTARDERLSKYYQVHRYIPRLASAIASFIVQRLTQEHQQYFVLERLPRKRSALNCDLTGETLIFDADMRLIEAHSDVQPTYVSSLDALACQVQEDLAVVRLAGHDWLSAVHLCFPNHWAAEAKIGRRFVTIHRPVPGIDKISANANALVRAMIYKGPYVRFVWGLGTDCRLNHHPESSRDVHEQDRQAASFDFARPELWLRVERQTSWGFPLVMAALFTIRTYFTNCKDIRQDPVKSRKLLSAIESMTADALYYKRLAAARDEIVSWLRS
ncbi:MAG: DUF3445 domain-containing protein [Acidiferrobacterales bacterium]|nr:DUF3445 domain-containing protein [Acidiferrobacterales bacterium]